MTFPARERPALLVSAALALAGLAAAWTLGARSPGLDFYQFWVVAQVAGRGDVPSVYAEDARLRLGPEYQRRALTDEDSERRRVAARHWEVLEPTATPLLYAAFRPLAAATYERAFLAYRIVSLAALAAGLVVLGRRLGLGLAATLLLLAMLGLGFQPLAADIRVGNVNQVQIGLLAAWLWLSAREESSRAQWAAGALLALAVLFKPNLVAVVPLLAATWLLGGRRRKLARQAVGMAAGVAIGLVASALVFGTPRAWLEWLEYLRSLPPGKIPLRFGNMGLARLLLESFGVDAAAVLALTTLAITLGCLWRGRRAHPTSTPADPAREDGTALAAGCLVYLLSAPMVWLHYLLLAVPAVIVLLRPRADAPGDGRAAVAILALVAIAVDPWANPLAIGDLRDQAVVTSLGVVALFALVCADLARGPEPPAVEAPGAT